MSPTAALPHTEQILHRDCCLKVSEQVLQQQWGPFPKQQQHVDVQFELCKTCTYSMHVMHINLTLTLEDSAKSKPCAYPPVRMHSLTQEPQKVQPIGLQAVLSLLSDRG